MAIEKEPPRTTQMDTNTPTYEPAEEQSLYTLFDTIETASHIVLVVAPTIDMIGTATLMSRACDKIDKECEVRVPLTDSVNDIVLDTHSDSLVIGIGVTLPKVENDSTIGTEEVEIIGEQPPDSYDELTPREIGELIGTGQGIAPVRLTPDGETKRLTPNTSPVSALHETAQEEPSMDTDEQSNNETNTTETQETMTAQDTDSDTTNEEEPDVIDMTQTDGTDETTDDTGTDTETTNDTEEANENATNDVPIFNPITEDDSTENTTETTSTSNTNTQSDTETTSNNQNSDTSTNQSQSKKFTAETEVVDIASLTNTNNTETDSDSTPVDTGTDETDETDETEHPEQSPTNNKNNTNDEDVYGPLPETTVSHPDELSDETLKQIITPNNDEHEETSQMPPNHPDWSNKPTPRDEHTKKKPFGNPDTLITDGGVTMEPLRADVGHTVNATKNLETFVEEVTQHIQASNVFENPNSWLVTAFLHANPHFDSLNIQDTDTLPPGIARRHYQNIRENVTQHDGLGFVLDNVPSSLTWSTYVHGMFSNSASGLAQLAQQTTVSPPPNMDDEKWEDTVPNFETYLLQHEYERDTAPPHLKRFTQHNRIDTCSLNIASDVYTFEGVADIIETLSLNQPEQFTNKTIRDEEPDTTPIETWKQLSEHAHTIVSTATPTTVTDTITRFTIETGEYAPVQVARLLHDVKSNTPCTIVETDSITVCISYDDTHNAKETLEEHDPNNPVYGNETVSCSR